MTIGEGRAYTKVLYVSKNGSNTDGSNWNLAYTTFAGAYAAASASANELTCIMIGPGTYDLDTAGDPTYTKNIVIRGGHRNKTTITNTNVGATSIMKFTGFAALYYLTFDVGATGINGVIFSGASASGSRVFNCYFECENAMGAQTALYVGDTIEYIKCRDVIVHGAVANTKSLRLNGCTNSWFEQFKIFHSLVGVHLDTTNDENNVFEDTYIYSSATGLLIDAGADYNSFETLKLRGNTLNINDSGTGTIYKDVDYTARASVAPDDLTGVEATANGAANTWGVAAALRAASATPYEVTGIVFEPNTQERYGLKLSSDGGSTNLWQGVVEGRQNQVDRILFDEPVWCNQGTAITAYIKSETGGKKQILWVKIKTV